jgi:hypothetical protein
MPAITNSNHAAHQDTSRRSYITSGAFNDHFYTYSINESDVFNPVGSLVPVTSDPGLCPSGRVLRETGRKLYPGVHPNITNMMVMVYDDQTLLKGFINPNYSLFSVFSTDKSYFLSNNTEPAGTTAASSIILATEQLGYRTYVPQIQQLTSKTTAVTLNGPSGKIITDGENLAAGALVTFRLYNNFIQPNDFLLLNHTDYIGDIGRYTLNATCGPYYADIHIRNITQSNLSANQIIQFVVIKVAAP